MSLKNRQHRALRLKSREIEFIPTDGGEVAVKKPWYRSWLGL